MMLCSCKVVFYVMPMCKFEAFRNVIQQCHKWQSKFFTKETLKWRVKCATWSSFIYFGTVKFAHIDKWYVTSISQMNMGVQYLNYLNTQLIPDYNYKTQTSLKIIKACKYFWCFCSWNWFLQYSPINYLIHYILII